MSIFWIILKVILDILQGPNCKEITFELDFFSFLKLPMLRMFGIYGVPLSSNT